MLAGWMTLEARLASAFIVLLVFAAGMMPARVEAAPAQIGLNAVPPPRPSFGSRSQRNTLSPRRVLDAQLYRGETGAAAAVLVVGAGRSGQEAGRGSPGAQ